MDFMRRIYVSVVARFYENGKISPLWIEWKDGEKYEIDRILSVSRLSASRLHPGYLFHVRIRDRERDLGYDGRWYVNVYD